MYCAQRATLSHTRACYAAWGEIRCVRVSRCAGSKNAASTSLARSKEAYHQFFAIAIEAISGRCAELYSGEEREANERDKLSTLSEHEFSPSEARFFTPGLFLQYCIVDMPGPGGMGLAASNVFLLVTASAH